MSLYYDRKGLPITVYQWAELCSPKYRRVCQDFLLGCHVSTIWLGIDHSFGRDRPHIFETMIFGGWPCDRYMRRYSTEVEARVGHCEMLAFVRQECGLAYHRARASPAPAY